MTSSECRMSRDQAIGVFVELGAAVLVDPETERVRRYSELDREDQEFYDAAVLAIEALKEQEEGRWISVKEKLPPDSKPVLVASHEGPVYKAYYDQVHKCWRCTRTIKVTHWRKMVRGPDRRDRHDR